MAFLPYVYTVDGNAARNNNKIGIDIGDALAVRLAGDASISGQLSPHQAADPTGAHPFCPPHATAYGVDNTVVIARTVHGSSWHTKSGKSESWVVRFLRDLGSMDMGVSDKNIQPCKNDSDKGSNALNHCIGAMIDESYDCLQAVHRCLPECEKLCYSNSEDGPNRPTEPFEDTFWGTVEYHHPDWRAMARRFKLDTLVFPSSSFDAVWDQLLARGPPNAPHHWSHLAFLDRALHPAPVPRAMPSTHLAITEHDVNDTANSRSKSKTKKKAALKKERGRKNQRRQTVANTPKPSSGTTSEDAEHDDDPEIPEPYPGYDAKHDDHWRRSGGSERERLMKTRIQCESGGEDV